MGPGGGGIPEDDQFLNLVFTATHVTETSLGTYSWLPMTKPQRLRPSCNDLHCLIYSSSCTIVLKRQQCLVMCDLEILYHYENIFISTSVHHCDQHHQHHCHHWQFDTTTVAPPPPPTTTTPTNIFINFMIGWINGVAPAELRLILTFKFGVSESHCGAILALVTGLVPYQGCQMQFRTTNLRLKGVRVCLGIRESRQSHADWCSILLKKN